MDNLKDLIASIDALYGKATKGQWNLYESEPLDGPIEIQDGHGTSNKNAIVHWTGFDASDKPRKEKKANANLIIALVNSWPQIRDAIERMERDAERYRKTFEHTHVARQDSDACKQCGLDLRDTIHKRWPVDAAKVER